jgi:hypothetical protein
MSDWRERAKKLREELDRPERERQMKIEAERRRKEEEEDRRRVDEWNRKIDKWAKQRGFACHVCGVLASKPAQGEFHAINELEQGHYEEDWKKPGDLERCHKCRKWACKKHVESGICQICAS